MFERRWQRNLTVALALMVTSVIPAVAQEGETATIEPEHWAGVELAEAISHSTGIAISPLLGVGAMGAWTWFRTPEAQRDGLPWFAQEWFWLPALILVVLLVAKDPLLGWLPLVKKPLDALDVVEDKFSAVLAGAVVLPMLLAAFSQMVPSESAAVTVGPPFLLAITVPTFLSGAMGKVVVALAVIGMMAAFFLTWLAAHTINVLILVSPFGPLDTMLRAVKGLVLMVLVSATMIAPVLGLVVSLAIVLVAWKVAGWSYRFSVFGSVLAWDMLNFKHRHVEAKTERLRAFSAQGLSAVPVRTFGELHAESDGGKVFAYRPWLVLPEARLQLPAGQLIVGKELLFPVLLAGGDEDGERDVLVRFPPRFRGHEEELAERLDAAEVRLRGVRRHLGTVRVWLRDVLGEAEQGRA